MRIAILDEGLVVNVDRILMVDSKHRADEKSWIIYFEGGLTRLITEEQYQKLCSYVRLYFASDARIAVKMP